MSDTRPLENAIIANDKLNAVDAALLNTMAELRKARALLREGKKASSELVKREQAKLDDLNSESKP